MHTRFKPQIEATGEFTERLDVLLPAHGKENREGFRTLHMELLNVLRVEICAPGQPQKFAPQHFDLRIERHQRLVTVDLDDILHGLTPWLSSHFLMLDTAPLSVSGVGCGL